MNKTQIHNNLNVKEFIFDVIFAIIAGIIVGTAYFFFQNSNGFAPGGVGGLALSTLSQESFSCLLELVV